LRKIAAGGEGEKGKKAMIVMNVNDKKDQKIETYPYKGKPMPVKDVWIR